MTVHPLLVLRLAGTQAEMGAQHGALTRQVGGFEASAAYYPQLPTRLLASGARPGPERAAIRAIQPALEAAVRQVDRHRPEDLRDRSRAFYRELGVVPGVSRYVGVMDVFQNAIGLLARSGLVPFAQRAAAALPPACSTLMAWGEATPSGRLLHARSFDFPGIGVWERAPTVVLCRPDEGVRYGFLATRGADVPGVTAFNEAGLTLTAHTRFHRDVRFDGASIIDIGHEIARTARTLDEAIDVARRFRSASAWGLAVSSAAERRAVVLELTARATEVVEPRPGNAWVATTNRYQHPAQQVDEVATSAAWIHDCEGRLAALERAGRAGDLDVDALIRLLGSHADPDVPGFDRAAGGVVAAPYSVQSLVADLEAGVVHASVGDCPTGRGAFAEVRLDWDGPVGVQERTGGRQVARSGRFADPEVQAAHAHYVEAVRLEQLAARPDEVASALHAAADADPDAPTYAFLAGVADLAAGDVAAGRALLDRALAQEPSPFRRGQAHLWAARAADAAGAREDARAHRRELLIADHRLLAGHRQAAAHERPWSRRRLRGVLVHPALVDAG